jgi:hypothetical protein
MVLTLRLCILYLSGNNLQLLPYMSSNDWLVKLTWRVFTARQALSLYIRHNAFRLQRVKQHSEPPGTVVILYKHFFKDCGSLNRIYMTQL